MGRRGPAPKPTTLKLLDGNPGKRPISKREPKPTGGAPSMPSILPREAKAEWKRLVAEMPAEMLTLVDRAGLSLVCVWWAICHANIKTLDQDALEKSTNQWLKLGREFGLTSSARTRIEIADVPPKKRGRPSLTDYVKGKTG